MNTSGTYIAIGIVTSCSVLLLADTRPHDQMMREIGSTFGGLKTHLEAKHTGDVVEAAVKLSGLFKEVEGFWTPLPSGIALKAAKSVHDDATRLAAAAKAGDLTSATKLYGAIDTTCKQCHERHRVQMPDKTYRIRP